MGNWNTPNNSEPAHENVLKALADKDTYSLTMGQAGGVWTNLPVGSMLWNNSAGYFQRWNGSNAIPVLISVAGGGTGASTAAQARANLGANDAGNLTTGVLPTARLSGTYSINISGNAATATSATNAANAADSALLQGNNAAFYRNASNLNAGTVPAERLPLNNTVTSTSTTQAATANAVKTAHDRASTQLGGGQISGVYYRQENLVVFGVDVSITRVGRAVTLSFEGLVTVPNPINNVFVSQVLPSWARPNTDAILTFRIDGAQGRYLALSILRIGSITIFSRSIQTGGDVPATNFGKPTISYNA